MKNNTIDIKVQQLLAISNGEFIFPSRFTHADGFMWKILNPYTRDRTQAIVLCGVDEGIEHALDLAIKYISKAKDDVFVYGVSSKE